MSRTLVVVTCKRDQWNFELLCRSMGKFLEPCKVIIVYNESAETSNSWEKFFKRHCKPFINNFDVKLMYKEQFWQLSDENHLTEMEKSGWVDQQVLKLCVAEQVETEFYLVLDSKNFFIASTNINHIKQIQPESTDWCEPILKNWITTCCETFDVTLPSTPIKLTQNTTPYLLRTKSAKDLVEFFGGSKFLYKWFSLEARKEKHGPSEFFLYEIFTMRYGYRNLGDTKQNCIAFWSFMHTREKWARKDYILHIDNLKSLYFIKVAGIHSLLRPYWTEEFVRDILYHLNCGDIIPDGMPFIKSK